MRSGRSINSTWTEQLDKLPVPAGSSFDKEAAWKKLDHRLHNKVGRKRKPAYIWGLSIPVAASLFYFLFLFEHHKEQEQKTGPAIIFQPDNKITPGNQIINTKTPATAFPVSKKNNAPAIMIDKKNEPGIKKEDNNETTMINQEIISTVDSTPSANLIATTPVITKKLRVIHNNELGGATATPEIERTTVAVANARGLFRGLRKNNLNSFEEVTDDTIKKYKPKRSLLPFSSLISQKE